MIHTLLKLFASLALVGLLAGCAHHPHSNVDEYGSGHSQYTKDCDSLPFNSHARKECFAHRDGHHHSEGAAIFGYVIFRVVVESMIHALIYR